MALHWIFLSTDARLSSARSTVVCLVSTVSQSRGEPANAYIVRASASGNTRGRSRFARYEWSANTDALNAVVRDFSAVSYGGTPDGSGTGFATQLPAKTSRAATPIRTQNLEPLVHLNLLKIESDINNHPKKPKQQKLFQGWVEVTVSYASSHVE